MVGTACIAPPLTSYATQVYPELPAGLCVVAAVGALTGRLDGRSVLVVVGAVVALPWLAVKYAPVAAVLAVALLGQLWRSDRHRARLGAAAWVIAGVVYLAVHQRVYGGWTVYAAGAPIVDGELLVVGNDPNYLARSRRLLGLLVDRGFGLGAWTPSLLALPAALVALVRSGRRGSTVLVATVLVGRAVATWVALTMQGWWWPGRQVVVVLPLAVVAMAVLGDRFRVLLAPIVIGSLLGSATWLWLVVEASTDRRTIIVDFASTSNPWYRVWSQVFPDLQQPGVGDWILYGVWGVVLAASCVVVWRSSAPEGGDDQLATAAVEASADAASR